MEITLDIRFKRIKQKNIMNLKGLPSFRYNYFVLLNLNAKTTPS